MTNHDDKVDDQANLAPESKVQPKIGADDRFIEDCLSDLKHQADDTEHASSSRDSQHDVCEAPAAPADLARNVQPMPAMEAESGNASEETESPAGVARTETTSVPRLLAVTPVSSSEFTKDTADEESLSDRGRRADVKPDSRPAEIQAFHVATSTFLSLIMVLVVLLLARLLVPPLVESTRYSWYRGQLRAEYELSGQQLKSVSLDSLADVSQLVSRRMGPSVVHINLLRAVDGLSSQDRVFVRENPLLRYEGQGSGFVIDSEGLILTNYHVLEDGGEIEISLADGRRLPGQIVGADPATDLAVIRIPASGLMPVEWGDSDDVSVGTPVWAVGSPFGLQQTVTFGIISGKHRVDFRSTRAGRINAGTPYGDLMQSDVALNPGNSGGPLVNAMGQVVGVNAAILGDTFQGVSFSIPSQVAQRVAKYLIEEGEVPRGWLGVELRELNDEERVDAEGQQQHGVVIRRFPANYSSPAKAAGLEVGDRIVSFEGVKVTSTASLIRYIGEAEVGAEVTLRIVRDGLEQDVQVRLDRRSEAILPR